MCVCVCVCVCVLENESERLTQRFNHVSCDSNLHLIGWFLFLYVMTSEIRDTLITSSALSLHDLGPVQLLCQGML